MGKRACPAVHLAAPCRRRSRAGAVCPGGQGAWPPRGDECAPRDARLPPEAIRVAFDQLCSLHAGPVPGDSALAPTSPRWVCSEPPRPASFGPSPKTGLGSRCIVSASRVLVMGDAGTTSKAGSHPLPEPVVSWEAPAPLNASPGKHPSLPPFIWLAIVPGPGRAACGRWGDGLFWCPRADQEGPLCLSCLGEPPQGRVTDPENLEVTSRIHHSIRSWSSGAWGHSQPLWLAGGRGEEGCHSPAAVCGVAKRPVTGGSAAVTLSQSLESVDHATQTLTQASTLFLRPLSPGRASRHVEGGDRRSPGQLCLELTL